MTIQQIYTGCLAQGAYYIESNGEAAIIDPLREVEPYLERAQQEGATIKYIFETHFHADFVSGHLDLSKKTGSPIVFGPNADPGFDAIIAEDQQEFRLGAVTLRALHTPGHTMESTCYLLLDENDTEKAVFTGDTLFIGDVGRPDLAQKAGELTTEDLAGHLYDSLQNKIMILHDDIIVYPAHGAGSACGKNMSKETYDTLGHQKEVNYALRAESKEQFIKEVTEGILPPPAYFPKNVQMNKQGYEALDNVMKKGTRALSPEEFETVVESTGALVLDTRPQQVFKDGLIPRSIFIGLNGDFAPWVGTLVADTQQPIVFVADEGKEQEVVTRLSRVGFDHTLGYLKGGINAWKAAGKEIDTVKSIPAEEFVSRLQAKDLHVYDVRKDGEWATCHLPDAHHTSLQFLNDHLAEFKKGETNYVHCAGGYRSMIAASMLKAKGYHNVVDVAGGMGAIKKTEVELKMPNAVQ